MSTLVPPVYIDYVFDVYPKFNIMPKFEVKLDWEKTMKDLEAEWDRNNPNTPMYTWTTKTQPSTSTDAE